MNIVILAVGKVKTEFYEPAIAEYQKRLGRFVKLGWRFVPTSDPVTESQQLLRYLPADCPVILLDERGGQRSTLELASYIENLKNQSTKTLVFIIGGSHGVTHQLTKRADAVLSLSRLVFPHEQVRLMLVEQLYRAYDINAGGSYHHA
jgi:23S rRNA (pseudouridine1915-N3)-methyltransferase